MRHEQVLRRIDEQIRGLEGTSKASTELRLPSKAQLYDDLGSEFQTREAEVVQALRAVRDFLGAAVQALEDKKHRVFEQVTLGAGVIPACTGRRPTQANGSVRLVPLAPKSPSAPNLSLRRAPASPGHATTPWPSANLPPKGLTCSVIIAV